MSAAADADAVGRKKTVILRGFSQPSLQSMPPELSVVVPAYNESRRLGPSLDAIIKYIDDRGIDAEVIVVDDGSADETASLARDRLAGRCATVLVNHVNRGKGYAVRRGVLHASGRYALVTDADLSCSIAQHRDLELAMREQRLDVAIGSRSLGASVIAVRQHLGRELMGKSFNRFVRVLTGLPYGDTQCGFKLVDVHRTRNVFARMTIDRFAFDVEFLVLCARAGLAIGEVPVVWRNSRDSCVNLVNDPARMLWDVLRLAMRGDSRRDVARAFQARGKA